MKRLSTLLLVASQTAVGGQAVIEGVLMRSPRAFAVAVRKPNGDISIKATDWTPLGERFKPFAWPFLRGIALLLETLAEGMKALHYSAQEAGVEEDEEPISSKALTITMITSLVLAFVLFKATPHIAAAYINSWLGLPDDVSSVAFHVTDGIIKMGMFVGYILLISQMNDIRRVFQYHGAEHKSIHAFEHGMPLDVANTRGFSRLHPRCGTTFLVFVILISLVVFAAVFPFLPVPTESSKVVQVLVTLAMKIPLLFPIAGISYEILRWTGKLAKNPKIAPILAPGLVMQRLTTNEPADDQLEVGLTALRAALDQEGLSYERGDTTPVPVPAA